jgi:hypothetical protein
LPALQINNEPKNNQETQKTTNNNKKRNHKNRKQKPDRIQLSGVQSCSFWFVDVCCLSLVSWSHVFWFLGGKKLQSESAKAN